MIEMFCILTISKTILCDIVHNTTSWFCKMLLLGKLRISRYYFLQLYVNLQIYNHLKIKRIIKITDDFIQIKVKT